MVERDGSLSGFHPAVAQWFAEAFGAPTPCQHQAWPAIGSGAHTLIAAPTGSGKTLAAFLCAIDELIREGQTVGPLPDATRVLYVSPLKALSNDIKKNLEVPLQGVRARLAASGLPDVDVRAWVRTGDTPPAERDRMRRRPPHILVTTPESLYILLTSESGRTMLSTVHTAILDEIHAVAGNKRGAHLALSMERLSALTGRSPTRIGLSATQKPVDEMAQFLTGTRRGPCRIVDMGHRRERDLAIETTAIPLTAVMSTEAWAELYERLAELIRSHRTTLIFANTRRLTERIARHLTERLNEAAITAHHGSLAREHRLWAEQCLKDGQLRALVATSSLELGIDIGDVDLVCQIGSPRSIAALLQRVGRSGHALGATPKGRLFPTSRDDLVECTALLDAARRGELERLVVPEKPLDVLAQQIVGEVAGGDWHRDALYDRYTRAWPYRALTDDEFDDTVQMLAAGFSARRGRRGAHIHHDTVNRMLRGRRGARLTAVTNGGAIPDQFDYEVVLQPDEQPIGTLNEDFAFESLPGDIFQLGNTSYRILRVETGKVRVEDARGQPPNIPFWFGEAPGRSDELSRAVSRFRAEFETRLEGGEKAVLAWLMEGGLDAAAAQQVFDYLAAARAALTCLPTMDTIVLERFFDESGDTHVVIHSSYGSRLNRAWGLALRKRFCRKFNFELQAAALEDTIVLSLSTTHSFPLAEVIDYLRAETVAETLTQALLTAPMFPIRWRWNGNIALAVRRNRNGKRVPAQLQRMDAEDLMAVVFPDQIACQENIVGHREIPDHPLVRQTLEDCLHAAMDLNGLKALLTRICEGGVTVVVRELSAPSPLAQEILAARPYAFLDDAPAEERRTRAVQARGFMDPQTAADLGRLDPLAIAQIRDEARPEARTADELHDALVVHGLLTAEEGACGAAAPGQTALPSGWRHLFDQLVAERRATVVRRAGGPVWWVAAERLAQVMVRFPDVRLEPPIAAVAPRGEPVVDADTALRELLRGRLEASGPVTVGALTDTFAVPTAEIRTALHALEAEGFVMQGNFSGEGVQQWCERRLLARIHRCTVRKLRQEIEPVSAADFMRFLFEWQRITPAQRGEGEHALLAVISQLEGFEAAAAAWEQELLTARVASYHPQHLDALSYSGRVQWLRLGRPKAGFRPGGPVRTTPISLILRQHSESWEAVAGADGAEPSPLSDPSQQLVDELRRRGALFFNELVTNTGMLRSQIEQALGELVTAGLVTSDGFIGLRALLLPAGRRRPFDGRRRRRTSEFGIEQAGRWALRRFKPPQDHDAIDHAAVLREIIWVLLRRYGVVYRALLEREASWLPPWRALLPVFRRLEARGEIRGGRFVAGFAGEQFAMIDAIGLLRSVRRRPKDGTLVAVSGADPLNLVGIVVPGNRVPALTGNRVLYCDGRSIGAQIGRQIELDAGLDAHAQWDARNALLRRRSPRAVRTSGNGASMSAKH